MRLELPTWWPIRRCHNCGRWTGRYLLRWAIGWDSLTLPGRTHITLELRVMENGEGKLIPRPPEIFKIGPLCSPCLDDLVIFPQLRQGLGTWELRAKLRALEVMAPPW
jgi:hypothetical protein